MVDHIKNLKTYLKGNVTYNYYLKNKHEFYSDCEKKLISHCQDIKWLIDESQALYELVKEMREKEKEK